MPKIKLSNSFINKLTNLETSIDYFDTEIKGMLLRVYPTGKKVFQIYYRNEEKKQKRFTIGQYGSINLVQARSIAQESLGEIARGTDIQAEKRSQAYQSITFKEYLDEFYISWVMKNRRDALNTINRMNNTFKPLHTLKLTDINKAVINKFLHEYQVEHSVTDTTLNRMLANIKGAFTKAYEFGYTSANTIRGIKTFKESPHKIRYLSDDEKQRLFDSLDTAEKYVRDIVITAYYTGMRRGELFALQWKDIDFNACHIHVDKDKSKSGKGRNIPMHSKVIDLIKNIECQNKNDYVFKSPVTGAKLDNISKSWATLMKNAEIDSFRFHDLRHNFASTLVMKGVELASVRELLGHSDFKMTLRYAHLSPSYKKKDIDLMD